jgi:hypothetical protein
MSNLYEDSSQPCRDSIRYIPNIDLEFRLYIKLFSPTWRDFRTLVRESKISILVRKALICASYSLHPGSDGFLHGCNTEKTSNWGLISRCEVVYLEWK